MYLRSGRFVESVRVMLDAGATLDDPLLEAMLWMTTRGCAEYNGVKYGRALGRRGRICGCS